MSDAHEARLLLAILRERWNEVRALSSDRAPNAGVFVDLCRSCDVHPWVHSRLEGSGGFDLVGAEVERSLAEARRKCRADNLLLLARVEQALDLLLAEGIVPVALKGLDVLHRFHARFDERTLDDVDLLVPSDRLNDALSVLERAGFTMPPEPERAHWLRSSFEMPMTSPGPIGVAFEIHWSLGQERRYQVDGVQLYERAVPIDVCGRRILRLDENDAAAHLLVHHVQHYFDRRLKWVLDLLDRSRQEEFSWKTVAARLDSWGGSAAASLALLHVRKLFPDLVPEGATEAVPAAVWRRVLGWPLRSSHPLDLYRGTRSRAVQLYLAAIALERPSDLPAYLIHRARRDRVV